MINLMFWRLMFFTVFGYNSPRIEGAAMDGSQRHVVVSQKIVYPVGLTLDLANRAIYWIGTWSFCFVLLLSSLKKKWSRSDWIRHVRGRHRESQLRRNEQEDHQERPFRKIFFNVALVIYFTSSDRGEIFFLSGLQSADYTWKINTGNSKRMK